MWSDAGGGGFNTSYGGDDGGGYGTQQFSSPGPEAKKSQGGRIQNIMPLTIRSVLELDENKPTYCGSETNMVMVMGLIREVEVTSAKTSYTLDDTTGTILAVKWHDSELEEEPLMENTYCSVHGTFKTYQGNKHLLALHLEPVTDFNLITAHILEVMQTVLQLNMLNQESSMSNGAAMDGDGMSNSLMGYDGMGGGTSGMVAGPTTLTKPQKSVFDVIQASSYANDNSGCSRDEIKMKLKGRVTPQQVDDIVFYLSNEGHIYTTSDENHFKTTDT